MPSSIVNARAKVICTCTHWMLYHACVKHTKGNSISQCSQCPFKIILHNGLQNNFNIQKKSVFSDVKNTCQLQALCNSLLRQYAIDKTEKACCLKTRSLSTSETWHDCNTKNNCVCYDVGLWCVLWHEENIWSDIFYVLISWFSQLSLSTISKAIFSTNTMLRIENLWSSNDLSSS